MSNSNLQAAFIMPHPPIILPYVGRGEEAKIADTAAALDACGEQIKNLRPDTIVLVTPHAKIIPRSMVINDSKQTSGDLSKFGVTDFKISVDIDSELVEGILGECDVSGLSCEGLEMSLDHGTIIPLYFVLKQYRAFSLVHINYGFFSNQKLVEFGRCVSRAIERTGRRTVFIASGDLSHKLKESGPYGYVKQGAIFDAEVCRIISEGRVSEFSEIPKEISEPATECGLNSFLVLQGILDCLEVKQKLHSYQDTFGVGYAVASFLPISNRAKECKPDLEKRSNPYIALALKSIEHYLDNRGLIKMTEAPDDLKSQITDEPSGIFVSLKKEGKLRGCIGTISATKKTVVQEIIHNAVSAAFNDPRFPPVERNELSLLKCSVDVLSKPEIITDKSLLDIKRYGIIVTSGFRRGLLLPNIDGVDSIDDQIRIACMKGGISTDENFKLERFEALRHE